VNTQDLDSFTVAPIVVNVVARRQMPTRSRRSPPFVSVHCPVDFSDHARVALRFAAAVARRAHSALWVFYANDPLLVAAAAAGYNASALAAAGEQELRRFAVATLGTPAVKQLRPTFATAFGKPVREILRAVERESHDLVVVGTKGLDGAKRLLLGSTTSELLRRARVPILAVPPAEASRMGKASVPASWPRPTIVAAIELGARAADDVRRAADLARWFGTALTLVHVIPVPSIPTWMSSGVGSQLQARCRKAERALDRARRDIDVPTTLLVRAGYPPDEIARAAAEQKAGLIVLNLRGRRGLFGKPIGTCTYQVLCRGVAPVLALPDERKR
jgi:nucleotide-binding universal stress UspA family protein